MQDTKTCKLFAIVSPLINWPLQGPQMSGHQKCPHWQYVWALSFDSNQEWSQIWFEFLWLVQVSTHAWLVGRHVFLGSYNRSIHQCAPPSFWPSWPTWGLMSSRTVAKVRLFHSVMDMQKEKLEQSWAIANHIRDIPSTCMHLWHVWSCFCCPKILHKKRWVGNRWYSIVLADWLQTPNLADCMMNPQEKIPTGAVVRKSHSGLRARLIQWFYWLLACYWWVWLMGSATPMSWVPWPPYHYGYNNHIWLGLRP